jgi:hypothetical protein
MTFSMQRILNTSFEKYSAYFSKLVLAFAIPAIILEIATFSIVAAGGDPALTGRGLNWLSHLLYLFSTGVTYSILSAHQEGVELSFGQAVEQAFSSFGRLFMVSLWIGLHVFLRLLLVIPVVIAWFGLGGWADPSGQISLGILCLIPVALYPVIRYSLETSLAFPILIGDGTDTTEAIRQSRLRTKGLLMRIALLYVLGTLALLALIFATAMVVFTAASTSVLVEFLYAVAMAAVVGPIFPLLLWGVYLEAKSDPRFS